MAASVSGRVAVVGAGMSRFGVRPEPADQLFEEAFSRAAASVDKGLDPATIGEAFVGNLGMGGWQLGNLGPFLVQAVGLSGIPSRRVENACASGGYALRDAVAAVRSGSCDVAMAAGVEKMNDLGRAQMRYWLGVSGDTEWERSAGLTFPGVYAQMASRHMHEFGTTEDDLAHVAVKNHANGMANPNAHFQKAVALDKALASGYVAEPLRLFDCCSTTDGAAVAVVASEEAAATLTDDPVWVEGSGAAGDLVAAFERQSMTEVPATRAAAESALSQARREVDEIDLFEVHDCFTIAEILAVEDLGIAAKGEGGSLAREGVSARDGRHPVNPSGGLKAKGHPLGATGVAQVVEVFQQLRGEAGARQVDGAASALTHNVGGSGGSCAVHVFSR